MAAFKPLVMGANGIPQELPEGGTLNLGDSPGGSPVEPFGFCFKAENLDLPTIPTGGVVSVHTNGLGVLLAKAENNQKPAVGFMQDSTFTEEEGDVQTLGLFTLADWSQIAGAVELTPKAYYFLSPTAAGKITKVRPTGAGQVVQIVGQAVTPFTFSIKIELPILLS